MYTLVMALAAGVAMGNDPPAVSAETEQSLDLSGEWEGTWWNGEGTTYRATIRGGRLVGHSDGEILIFKTAGFTDEGGGKLHGIGLCEGPCLGIYEQDGDLLTLCFREASEGRPTAFRAGDGQHLLILHRVRPRQ
jgi:hypothetical protein